MTKQILAFLFCFIRELTLYSPLTYSLSSARELKPYTPPLPSPSTHPTLKIPPSKAWHRRFEQKNSLQHKKKIHVVTTKPTQVNLLNVINTQTFSE